MLKYPLEEVIQMKKYTGELSVIAAGILWGVISIFVRHLTDAGLASLQLVFLRSAMAAVGLFFWLFAVNRDALRVKLKDIWCFVGTGIVSLTFFSWCYFTTIQASEASIAVVLLYTSPIFVMLFSAVLFQEKITVQKLTALVMTFCGSVLVAGLVGGGHTLTLKVFLVGIGAGLGYGLYSIFGRFAIERGYGSLTITFYTFVFSSMSGAALCHVEQLPALMTPETAAWCAGSAVVCSIAPYLLYTYGLSRMEAGRAAILATVEPLVGAVVGIAYFQESHDVVKLAGMALIFGAIVLLNQKSGG